MSSRSRSALAAVITAVVGIGAAVAACDKDPVHDNEVSALGGEAAGVSPGPLHRPGQPCLVCHGGSGPASAQFSAGGTVYAWQSGSDAPQQGATVTLTDTDGSVTSATTNAAGNFYVPVSQWVPAFPVHVQIAAQSNTLQMNTHIGRDASCASCHDDPAGPATPGHVYVNFGSPDGGS